MPGDELELGRMRSAIVGKGAEAFEDVEDSPIAEVQGPYRGRGGTKIILRREDNLESFIEMDYNPTELPFSKNIKYNDKSIINGEEALEFQNIGSRQFTWAFLLNDWGYFRPKQAAETVRRKLNWLEGMTQPNRQYDKDFEPFSAPYIFFLEKGVDAIRVIIIKFDGIEKLLKPNFDPIRATLNITFRRVARLSEGGFRMTRTLRRRMF